MSTKVADNHRRVWKRLQRAGERGMTLTDISRSLHLSREQVRNVLKQYADDYETTGRSEWNAEYWRVKNGACDGSQ